MLQIARQERTFLITCFILNDTRAERHHGCEIVMKHLLRGLKERNIEIIGTLPIGETFNSGNQLLFKQANIIIINGEGTFHHCANYAKYLLQCGLEAKNNGQRVFLINSTWEENSVEMLQQVAKYDGIWLRDKQSLEEVKKVATHAKYAPDLTFAYHYQIANNIESVANTVVLTDSVYSYISDVIATYASKYSLTYAPIIRPLPTNPHQIGYNKTKLKKYRIYNFFSYITFNLYKPRRYYLDLKYAEYSTEVYWHTLKKASSLITARYHALCFGLQLEIPLLAIDSNTSKIKNLLNDIGIDSSKRIIDWKEIHTISPDNLINYSMWSTEEKEKIIQFKLNAQQKINDMLNEIKQSI